MPSLKKNPWNSTLCSILLALAVSGCQSGHKACEDIPPGAIPQPNGTYLCQWNHAETARADRDNYVIYQYEWAADATKLTQFGQDHLARIAQGLPQVCFPVLIERSSDQHLDELRRLAILEALANCHVPIVPERVVIGRPEAEGLYGQEALGVDRGMLSNQAGGGGAGATGGGASTSGGGGIGIY
jgi:hypothetical protein